LVDWLAVPELIAFGIVHQHVNPAGSDENDSILLQSSLSPASRIPHPDFVNNL